MLSPNPCDVLGFCFITKKSHNVKNSLLMNSVPLSVTRISGSPNFAFQCW